MGWFEVICHTQHFYRLSWIRHIAFELDAFSLLALSRDIDLKGGILGFN